MLLKYSGIIGYIVNNRKIQTLKLLYPLNNTWDFVIYDVLTLTCFAQKCLILIFSLFIFTQNEKRKKYSKFERRKSRENFSSSLNFFVFSNHSKSSISKWVKRTFQGSRGYEKFSQLSSQNSKFL